MQQLPPELEIFITADASPTLVFTRRDGYTERMHSPAGALSESLYIYGEALALALKRKGPPRVLSFGLGLGYNELITIATLERVARPGWKIYSFEAVEFLRHGFRTWALRGPDSELTGVIDRAARAIAAALPDVDPERLRDWTAQALSDGRLELRGSFPEDTSDVRSCNLVYYDAYSNKMDATPWGQEHLARELGALLDPDCILATYAATGDLSRALKRLGFCLMKKPGFKGKRDSTLAFRDQIR